MTGSIIKQVNVRKRFTAEQKMALVQATLEPGVRVVEVARKYNVGVSTLIKWRKNAMEGSLMSVKDDAPAVPASEVKKLRKELKQLQQLLGKKSLQIELLKEAVTIGREKKLISRQPLPGMNDIVSDL
jgi:transposase